mmetsp:Transcript_11108/g.20961  ORF Transcript_11108/g.20961 Transcript_11108/m.20961 type:complete len:550 (+) Transcript_11108:57-1706(+)
MADVSLGREALPRPPGYESGATGWENYKPSAASNGWGDDKSGGDDSWSQAGNWGADSGDKWKNDKWQQDQWAGYTGGGKTWGRSWKGSTTSWLNGHGGGLVDEENARVQIQEDEGPEEELPKQTNGMLLSDESFDSYGLDKKVLEGIFLLGYVKPSVIQAYTLPRILGKNGQLGGSLRAQAQNGSGKTACFSIAVLQAIDMQADPVRPQAMIISPTRELAKQNFDFMSILGSSLAPKMHLVVPGMDRIRWGDTIESHILVGTPGKMMDMVKKRFAPVNDLKVFVLDEADVMLDQENWMGNHVMDIRKHIKHDIQILFFSATYPDHVKIFAKQLLEKEKTVIKVSKEQLTVGSIRQTYKVCVDEEDKYQQLTEIYGALDVGQSIIFFNSRKKAFDLAQKMQENGFAVSLICGSPETRNGGQYGEEAQGLQIEQRDQVMEEFRSGVTRVLIATDVLCRGIDVPQVTLVVNFEMPYVKGGQSVNMETYLHRIGRTGRFGLKGVAVNLVTADEIRDIQEVNEFYTIQIEEVDCDWDEFKDRMMKGIRVDPAPA